MRVLELVEERIDHVGPPYLITVIRGIRFFLAAAGSSAGWDPSGYCVLRMGPLDPDSLLFPASGSSGTKRRGRGSRQNEKEDRAGTGLEITKNTGCLESGSVPCAGDIRSYCANLVPMPSRRDGWLGWMRAHLTHLVDEGLGGSRRLGLVWAFEWLHANGHFFRTSPQPHRHSALCLNLP